MTTRWRLDDPITSDVYIFEVSPTAGGEGNSGRDAQGALSHLAGLG